VEPLLDIAAALEERDARVAAELARVEQEEADVAAIRAHAAAAAEFLASLPPALAGFAADEERAEEDKAAARAAIAAAAAAEDELAAARARAALADAESRSERAREHQEALQQEGAARRDEAARLAARVGVDGLDAVLAWASQRRGELLVAHSGLARERDAVVREASELLSSVTGDAWAATSVAGLRGRLSRALP
jgi:hypothetical protein